MHATIPDRRPLTELPPETFVTPRLTLRAVQSSDVEPIFALFSSEPDICKYMSWKRPERPRDTQDFIDSVIRYREGNAPSGDYCWVITSRSTGALMGTCGFGPTNHYTIVGGYILHSAFWGQGYATEAWGCLVDWAKQQPGVYRIEAHHHVDNPASGKVMQKTGMVFEGVLRRASLAPNVSNEPQDAALYAWARG